MTKFLRAAISCGEWIKSINRRYLGYINSTRGVEYFANISLFFIAFLACFIGACALLAVIIMWLKGWFAALVLVILGLMIYIGRYKRLYYDD